MPRLFVALELPHHAASHLSMLRGGLPGARWIDMENYHLTLRFIGDIEHHMADEVAHALERVHRRPFALGFAGLGAFGGRKPHSLYAVPTGTLDLYDLQAEIAGICRRLGLPADPRKFTPHVTLARLRNGSARAVANYLTVRGGFHVTPFKVDRFVLMSSRNSVGGGPYIAEQIYPLSLDMVPARVAAGAAAQAFMSR